MNSRIPEGETVSFVGELIHDVPLEIGDVGRVLSSAGAGSHVLFATGACEGDIHLVSNADLVIIRQEAGRDDSLDGPIVTLSAREVWDQKGPTGLLNELNLEGHLGFFEPLAREAVEMIASNIRSDASFRPILSQLGREEGETLIALATSTLLRDAFGTV